MILNIDMILLYIRLFVVNMCVYYCFEKILNISKCRLRNNIILVVINLVLLFVYVSFRYSVNTFWPFVFLAFVYGVIISKITNNKLGYSLIITMVAYAISFVCHMLSVIIQFIPYKIIYKLFDIENTYLNLTIILMIQCALVYLFFKIKRFRNGFSFFRNKLNNESADIIMINISIIVILIYCLIGAYYDEIRTSLAITFLILALTMFFTIKKMFTMYYKQKLLTDTMEEYKLELANKQNEIDRLKEEKRNVSKITHEFYNRQKALELLVGSNMEIGVINKEGISPSVLKMIESLTNEYSQKFESTKDLPKLETTEIPELDNMFKYMQSECYKNNIEFKLKVVGNIHSLVNNVIPKNKLETLIGDHIRDAINAVNKSDVENKEILAVLGIKNKKYEFSVLDTGEDFAIDTLVKLGLEQVTTNKDIGGTGTGFMTTFETLNDTKASLVITEYPMSKERHYAKCVSIRFDGKKQYRICSYRVNEIKKEDINNRIKVEQYK